MDIKYSRCQHCAGCYQCWGNEAELSTHTIPGVRLVKVRDGMQRQWLWLRRVRYGVEINGKIVGGSL